MAQLEINVKSVSVTVGAIAVFAAMGAWIAHAEDSHEIANQNLKSIQGIVKVIEDERAERDHDAELAAAVAKATAEAEAKYKAELEQVRQEAGK